MGFHQTVSLIDADILLISPGSFSPYGDWVSFSSSDDGCYNVQTSNSYEEKMTRLKKELKDYLKNGKNVFLLLSQEEKIKLASSVTASKKDQYNYSTYLKSNYDFLPIDIGALTSASGKIVQFTGNPIFSEFHNKWFFLN